MAQFDVSEAVNSILSSRGGTAQELVGSLTGTVGSLTETTGGLAGGLTTLPGRRDVLGEAPDAGAPRQQRRFNPFDLVSVHTAVVMASKLMKIAEEAEGDGLDVAIGATALLGELGERAGEASEALLGDLGEASGLAGLLGGDLMTVVTAGAQEIINEVGGAALGLIGLREHALMLFITHYPPAHEKIKLEPLDQRQPNLVSRANSNTTPPEDRLDYWREDAQLNDHHGRWHAVNPTGTRPTSEGTLPTEENRHGELFVYMHLQMLARYDAERLGVDLPRVLPFDKYMEKMPQGYDPGKNVGTFGEDKKFTAFVPRPANAKLPKILEGSEAPPIPDYPTADLEKFRDALREAARLGYYPLLAGSGQIDGKHPDVSSDNLGNAAEASIASIDWPDKENPNSEENGKNYGNLHGQGHAQISYFDNNPNGGVLTDLSATVRDPMFWRWHKNIDTIIQVWRDRLGELDPYDFADGPPVTVRSEDKHSKDIIVCRQEGLPADVDGEQLGAKAFGYSEVASENRWDTDFSSGKTDEETVTTTDELLTEMRTRTIHPLNTKTMEPEDEDIDYLSHDDFSYFIRLQNHSDQAQEVTIRIFMAPERWVDDSTAWIEMDRFLHRLEGGERAVVFRPAKLSAVVRKPAVGHEELEGTKPRGRATVWCDCGWPYTLLLPRGTKEGLDFRLLVMLSGNDLSMDNTGEKCTSMSYCGLQDKIYPDERPMGYPFDRPLPGSIDSIIDKHENWASRKIKIRCRKF